jgi:hypothetical protein
LAGSSSSAWYVNFVDGSTDENDGDGTGLVRCVR